MYSRNVRIALLVSTIAFAAYDLYSGRYATGVLLLVAAALVVRGYYRAGTVWLAFRNLRNGKVARARVLLAQIPNPDSLSSQQRAYYEFSMGGIALEDGQPVAAEGHLRCALEHQLRSARDRTVVEAQLAAALVGQNRIVEARHLIAAAREQDLAAEVRALFDGVERAIGPAA